MSLYWRNVVTFALERLSLPVIIMGASQGGLVTAAIAAADDRVAAAFPDFQVPVRFYLKYKRVCPKREFWDKAQADELCLRQYSLHFLASLFTTRFSGLFANLCGKSLRAAGCAP